MRILRTAVLSLALLVALAPVSHAVLGKSKTPEEKAAEQLNKATKEAESLYGKAYQEIARGQKDLGKGDEKKALKRFDKAMKWSEKAVELLPDYYEAWNLVGFTARKRGDYERSLAAYRTCLGLQPDYVPAIAYLGEALTELDRLDEARQQVEELRALGATEEADTLAARIEAAERARAESAGSAS